MTDLRERLGKMRGLAEASDPIPSGQIRVAYYDPAIILALLNVAEAALPYKERAMLRHMPELDAALSRLSTAIGGQHE